MAMSAAVFSKSLMNFTACFTLSLIFFESDIFPLPKSGKKKNNERVEQDQCVVTNGTKLGEPLRVLHRYVEHIAVEYPGRLTVELNDFFIRNLEIAEAEAGKLSKHFVVVAGEVSYLRSLRQPTGDMLYHLHMRLSRVALAVLPHVYDIAVENYSLWLDRLKVFE